MLLTIICDSDSTIPPTSGPPKVAFYAAIVEQLIYLSPFHKHLTTDEEWLLLCPTENNFVIYLSIVLKINSIENSYICFQF